MDDIQARLMRCFSVAFPALSTEEIVKASTASVKVWDSVASVTLFAMIEEEYGIEMDMQDLSEMISFERILVYLRKQSVGRE